MILMLTITDVHSTFFSHDTRSLSPQFPFGSYWEPEVVTSVWSPELWSKGWQNEANFIRIFIYTYIYISMECMYISVVYLYININYIYLFHVFGFA